MSPGRWIAFWNCTIPKGLLKDLRSPIYSPVNHCLMMPAFTFGSQMPTLNCAPTNACSSSIFGVFSMVINFTSPSSQYDFVVWIKASFLCSYEIFAKNCFHAPINSTE